MKGKDNDIDKYLRGELTAAERHALEKKALTDPFLADALEGAGQIKPDEFSGDIKSLNKRIQGGKPMFTPLRIAAGVLIVVAASWMTLSTLNETQPEQLGDAKNQKQQSGVTDSSAAGPTATKDELLSENREEKKVEEPKNERKRERATESPRPSVATREDGAVETQPAETAEQAEETVRTSDELAEGDLAQSRDTISTQFTPPVATQGLAKSEQQETKEKAIVLERRQADMILSQDRRTKRAAGVAKESESAAATMVTGKVTLADDGLALPGVNVRLKGSSRGTVTDLNGNYTIEVNESRSTLVFSFIGLQTQEATTVDGGKLDVKLTEDVSQLSEVVVTGRAMPADLSGEPVIRLAEPVGGLRAYDKYLEGNLRYPQQARDNNVKGRVSIQFTVETDGALNEFKVLKGLGYGCDEEVIRLVKDGPAWIPSTEDNVPTESIVRVRMRFDPSK